MNDNERKLYEANATVDKDRYDTEMKAYNEKNQKGNGKPKKAFTPFF